MSILHVNHIRTHLENNYKAHVDMSKANAKRNSTHFENSFLSKALAAFGVHILSKAQPQDISKYVFDGGDDNGIDCVYIDNNENILYLVQSKWITTGDSEPSSGDVKKFADGIRDLVNFKFDRFNDDLNKYQLIIKQAINDPRTRYIVVLVYTGTQGPAIHSQRTLEDLLSEMNDAGELMKMKVLKQKDLHNSIASSVNRDPINIDIGLRNWGKIEFPSTAFYGTVNCSTLADWWNTFGDQLFAKNIRGFLGNSDVNSEIQNSLENEPDKFWYYNNGITIIADKISKTLAGGGNTDFGTFYCDNISIVNGAQTVSAIGKYAGGDPQKVCNSYVNCRIIELNNTPEGFGSAITRTNNRQNKIENRDFVTQDPEQIRIRTEAFIEGYTYMLLRADNTIKDENTFNLIDATTALSCISKQPSIFVQLKREIGKLWEDITKPPYKTLFNPNVSGPYVIKAVQLQSKIDKIINSLQKDRSITGKKLAILIHGNRMIAALTYSSINLKNLGTHESDSTKLLEEISEARIKKSLEFIVKEIENNYSNSIIPTLFKNLSKCTDIFNAVIQAQKV